MKYRKLPFNLSLLKQGGPHLPISLFTHNFSSIDQLKDYSVPGNSYFPPRQIIQSLHNNLEHALKYAPQNNQRLSESLALFSNVTKPNTLIASNGVSEIIAWLSSLVIRHSLFVTLPTYSPWIDHASKLGIKIYAAKYRDENLYQLTKEQFVIAVRRSRAKNVVICNPNNPTGSLFSYRDLIWILERLANLDNVIVDESFIDFSSLSPPSIKNAVSEFGNVWLIKSFDSSLGMHGLYLGCTISNEKNIARLKRHMPHWSINGVADTSLSLVQNEHEAYQVSRIKTINDSRYLAHCLSHLKVFRVSPATSNFVYARLSPRYDGLVLRNRLLANHACLVHNCQAYVGATQQHFCFASRPKEQVNGLISAMMRELYWMKSAAQKRAASGQAEPNSAVLNPTHKKKARSSKIPLPSSHIFRKP